MGRGARLFLALLGIAAAAGGGVIWGSVQRFDMPGPLGEEKAVMIPRGSGVLGIARRLGEEGVIDEPLLFMAGAKLLRVDRELKAGEYLFPAHVSLGGTLDIIRSGKVVVRRVTVAEGLTSAQVVALLSAESGLAGTIDKVPANGTLLPETYHFTFGDNRNQLIERMQV
ncbi:MAG TPA: endolytic transglycosylase MltG, partial [Azospirillaceae bacterium]|nr:endolytic transglycosylase MltG [Azospirillaceae bacterium]